jgi:hypothetical protein
MNQTSRTDEEWVDRHCELCGHRWRVPLYVSAEQWRQWPWGPPRPYHCPFCHDGGPTVIAEKERWKRKYGGGQGGQSPG